MAKVVRNIDCHENSDAVVYFSQIKATTKSHALFAEGRSRSARHAVTRQWQNEKGKKRSRGRELGSLIELSRPAIRANHIVDRYEVCPWAHTWNRSLGCVRNAAWSQQCRYPCAPIALISRLDSAQYNKTYFVSVRIAFPKRSNFETTQETIQAPVQIALYSF